MALRFHKMQGCGNDFIFVDAMNQQAPEYSPKQIQSMCDRTFGAGADGVVVLTPGTQTDAKWIFYNNDGSQAEMCGNAARCAMRFLKENYFAQSPTISLETLAGVIRGRVLEDGRVETTLLPPGFDFTYEEKTLKGPSDEPLRCFILNTGVPHAVIEVEDIKGYPITKVGKHLVKHPAFGSAGTNVTFFEKQIGSNILSTTFERGVEKETFACGTGVAAASIVFSQLYFVPPPIKVTTPGGLLEVDLSPQAKTFLLRGPASYVMEVNLKIDESNYEKKTLYEEATP